MRLILVLSSCLGGCLAGNPAWGEDESPNQGTTRTGAEGSSSSDFASTGLVGPAYADIVTEDAPLAYWRFGDATTPTAIDEMGAHPGQYQGSVVLGESDLVASSDGAVRLGWGTRIVMGDELDLADAPFVSLEAWINPETADDSWPKIIHNTAFDERGQQGYVVEMTPEGFVSSGVFSDDELASVQAPIELGVTTHVVVTYDGATLRIYTNGVETGSHVKAVSLRPTDASLTIGSNNNGPDAGSYFYGVVDEVAIYDDLLSAERIQAHYTAGVGG